MHGPEQLKNFSIQDPESMEKGAYNLDIRSDPSRIRINRHVYSLRLIGLYNALKKSSEK